MLHSTSLFKGQLLALWQAEDSMGTEGDLVLLMIAELPAAGALGGAPKQERLG